MDVLAQPRTRWVAALAALALASATLMGISTAASADATVSISGTVTLPAGASVAYLGGVTAAATPAAGGAAVTVAVSPTTGAYTIGGLAPGNYKVRFASSSPDLVSEYYNGVFSSALATVVNASTANATGVNASLEWAGSISGTVSIQALAPSAWLKGVKVVVEGASGVSSVGFANPTTGAYTVGALPPGDYHVRFMKSPYWDGVVVVPGFLEEYYNDVYGPTGATKVAVGPHASVTGIDAVLDPVGHFTVAPAPTVTAKGLTVGSSLGLSTGAWLPAPSTFTFQWNRDGVPIAGEKGTTYDIVPPDRGHTISVTVTAKLAGFTSASRTSTAVLIPLSFTTTPTPTITGTAKSGSTLTANPRTWAPVPDSFAYTWKRDGAAIPGATNPTYVLTPSDRGKKVTVTVTAAKAGYAKKSKTSAELYIPKVFTKIGTPTISGTARAGKTLTAHRGTWSPTPTYSYQWYRNGAKISGATASTYKLTAADKGKQITVRVAGKRSGYLTAYVTSAAKTIAK